MHDLKNRYVRVRLKMRVKLSRYTKHGVIVARSTDIANGQMTCAMTARLAQKPCVARLASLAGIAAQIGRRRRPGRYGGNPAVVADNTLDQ